MNDSKLNKLERCPHEFGRWRMFAAVPLLLVYFGCDSPNGEQAMDPASQQQVIDDPVFGRLEWKPRFRGVGGEWEGSFRAASGQSCRLRVSPRSKTDRSVSDEGRRVFAEVSANIEGIRQRTADEFLTPMNEGWGWNPPLTREQFLSHLQLSGIFVNPDGSVLVEFDDMSGEDIFGGHGLGFLFHPDGRSEASFSG